MADTKSNGVTISLTQEEAEILLRYLGSSTRQTKIEILTNPHETKMSAEYQAVIIENLYHEMKSHQNLKQAW